MWYEPKSGSQGAAMCVTDVHTTYHTEPGQHGIYLFYLIKKQKLVNGDIIYGLVLQ